MAGPGKPPSQARPPCLRLPGGFLHHPASRHLFAPAEEPPWWLRMSCEAVTELSFSVVSLCGRHHGRPNQRIKSPSVLGALIGAGSGALFGLWDVPKSVCCAHLDSCSDILLCAGVRVAQLAAAWSTHSLRQCGCSGCGPWWMTAPLGKRLQTCPTSQRLAGAWRLAILQALAVQPLMQPLDYRREWHPVLTASKKERLHPLCAPSAARCLVWIFDRMECVLWIPLQLVDNSTVLAVALRFVYWVMVLLGFMYQHMAGARAC